MQMGRETPMKPCSDSRHLQYRVAELMVDTGTSGGNALPTDVVD